MMPIKVSVLPTPIVEVPYVEGMTVESAFSAAGKEVESGYKFKIDGNEIGFDDVIETSGRESVFLYATKMIKGNK